jgi:2-succinyl-5-enolpyruvyl-6-hydroxy-3-cyclohexene-1-carboxylate synthase
MYFLSFQYCRFELVALPTKIVLINDIKFERIILFMAFFEKVFGTPHGKDLWQISESFGFATTRVTTQDELGKALRRTSAIPGVHIVICLTGERDLENALLKQINHQVVQALSTSAH